MKKLILFSILVYLSNVLHAQAPGWEWEKAVSGGGDYEGMATTADSKGNVYTLGTFTDSIAFGGTGFTSLGGLDIFVVKYDAQGNVLWARAAGSVGVDQAGAIAADNNGNVYVGGGFSGATFYIGSDSLVNVNTGSVDAYFAKFDSVGNLVWANSLGGTASELVTGLSADNVGNVYVAGYFNSSSLVFNVTPLANAGSSDVFIAKYNSAGANIWAQVAGGPGAEVFAKVSNDASGNVYMTGAFSSNSITFNSTQLTNAAGGEYDIFIVRYDSSGNFIWAKSAGSNRSEYAGNISTDASGNSFILGYFDSHTVLFGSSLVTCVDTTSYDVFIVKYDALGNAVWSKSIGAVGTDFPGGLTLDNRDNIYVAGYFTSSIISIGGTTLTNAGGTDIFVAKYDSSGNTYWAKNAGGAGNAFPSGIGGDASGNLYMAGTFAGSSIVMDSFTLTNSGAGNSYNAFFVARLGDFASGIDNTPLNTEGVTVFPNPSNGTFYFKGIKTGARLDVYNVLGEMIYSSIAIGDKYSINLAGNSKGIYFYRVINNTGTVGQGKVVLE